MSQSKNNQRRLAAGLFWALQNEFTSSELRRFTESYLRKENSTRSELDIEPRDIFSAALACVCVDRKLQIQDTLESVFSTKSQQQLLSRFEIEALICKPLPADFPLALRFAGEPDILKNRRVGIIGSRHPTFYGREQAARFAKSLAEQGVCVISGAAIGIDTVANVISHASGTSVAILGSGLSLPYPSSNRLLLENMAQSGRGLVVSEFEDHQRAEKWNFPRRNRIIAALCDFLLVVEAGLGSGSMITAHLAAAIGVDVGAIPGPIHSPTSQGSNQLIKEGAFCIESPEEILERLANLGHQNSGIREIPGNDATQQSNFLSSLF